MNQKILDLNDDEREWVKNNLVAINGIVRSLTGEKDIVSLTPVYLDEAYKAWVATHTRGVDDPNPIINAFGVGFGQYLVDHQSLEWKIVKDDIGTEIAVFGAPGNILFFPPKLVAKRYEKEETNFFVPLYNAIIKQIGEIRKLHGVDCSKYSAGQVWKYKTRPGEENSTFTIVKVDKDQLIGTIIHIYLQGLFLKDVHMPDGYSETVGILPFIEEAIGRSATELIRENEPVREIQNRYEEWKHAFESGGAGVFSITIAEAVAVVEEAIRKAPPPQLEPVSLLYHPVRKLSTYQMLLRRVFDDSVHSIRSNINLLPELKKAIEADPGNYTNFWKRAAINDHFERYQQAISDYSQVIALKPNYVEAYINRAVDYAILEDYTRAFTDLKEAIKLEPNNVLSYLNRSYCHFRLKTYEAAFQDVSRAISLYPYFPNSYLLRARINLDSGTVSPLQVGLDATRAIELDPENVEAYMVRGELFTIIDRKKRALADFTKAIYLQPNDFRPYYFRGETYFSYGDSQSALEDLNKAIELAPDVPELYYLRSCTLLRLDFLVGALEDADTFMRLAPEDPAAFYQRGLAHLYNGNHRDSLQDFDKYISLQPDELYGYYYRSIVYFVLNNLTKALVDLNKALDINPEHASLLLFRGQIFSKLGEIQKAVEDIKKSINLGLHPKMEETARKELEYIQESG
jgi:tetratricopeptide (TPR) repeat protein